MPSRGKQTETGKAFEYACAKTISQETGASIIESAQSETARHFFNDLSETQQSDYIKGAKAAVIIIKRLEPNLLDNTDSLSIELATDALGQAGDVRDVICKKGDWQIGLSCKHNHEAVKHSRLSGTIDFGDKWFGLRCSAHYFNTIIPIFERLKQIQQSSSRTATWDMVNKEQDYYVPVLNAFIEEVNNLDRSNPGVVPERLIRYLIGKNDFYKVIMNESRRFTKIESININGTLNKSTQTQRALVDVPIMRMPTRFYDIGFEENNGMANTIHVVCDQGWNVSMRIHNASSKIEPSLKFDVQLQAMPNSILTQIQPWD